MSNVLVSGKALKAAGDKVRIGMDFGNLPQLIAGYSIASYTITCSGLTVASPQMDYTYQISALFSGGTAGTDYSAVYTVTLDDPDATIVSRTGTIRVK